MRKWTICALAVLALLGSVMTASAQELTEALPPEAQELLDGLEEENTADGGLGAGLARLWEKGCGSFLDILRQSLRGVVLLLGAVLVCGVAEDCLQAAGSEVNYVSMAGALGRDGIFCQLRRQRVRRAAQRPGHGQISRKQDERPREHPRHRLRNALADPPQPVPRQHRLRRRGRGADIDQRHEDVSDLSLIHI